MSDAVIDVSGLAKTFRAGVRMRRVHVDGRADAPVIVGASSAARAAGFPRMAVRGDEIVLAWTVPGTPSVLRVARARMPATR